MKCDPSIKNRAKRVYGQMNGVINMMEEERTCEEIVTQLSAIRSSVDKMIALITTNNLIETIESNNDVVLKDVDEAIQLLVKSK